MDAPRDFFFFFFFFLRTSSARARGGGGDAARLFFFFFPCSADHERDWPPCKVVFFGLATNALNVRNNNNPRRIYSGHDRRGREFEAGIFAFVATDVATIAVAVPSAITAAVVFNF